MAGLYSPTGGSAKISGFVKQGRITGVVSEVILDEVMRHVEKFDFASWKLAGVPHEETVKKYNRIVIDEGDSHVLASCEEEKVKYLVTLDKKHLLTLKGKITGLEILTPGELIGHFS